MSRVIILFRFVELSVGSACSVQVVPQKCFISKIAVFFYQTRRHIHSEGIKSNSHLFFNALIMPPLFRDHVRISRGDGYIPPFHVTHSRWTWKLHV